MHTREEKMEAFGRLLDVQTRLRKECPWDKKQTFESLRPNTIEEVFELADALMKRNLHDVMKELGDVMEHVIFYSILGKEEDVYDIADVCNQETKKLMFRHPFIDWTGWPYDPKADLEKKPADADGVEETWEQIKQKEKDGNTSVLSGVPDALPSLIKAYRIQDKARNVGFDWQKKEDVWKKVYEELGELEVELKKEDKENSTKELGDFLFSVINAARLYHLNPDNALEHTNQKFIHRFNYIEQKSKEMNKSLKDMTLTEMDDFWNEAKKQETK
ncbi:MAG: nucleoside triphosphate pyrophosphohydrolase [Prevotella sp.]|jgi:MazG family protein|nr:nucleoside triphosphate pyrophosphohydrolase [Prevotella sp.]MCI1281674.1 nucleoside triphosphate pyrophosphohydrolase [Prevotella sp.]